MSDAIWGFVGVVVGALLAGYIENRRKLIETRFGAWSAWASAARIGLNTAVTCLENTKVPQDVKEAFARAVKVKQETLSFQDAYRELLKAEAAVLLIERDRAVRTLVSSFSRELNQPTVIKELNDEVNSQQYQGTSIDLWTRVIRWFDITLTERLDRFLLDRAEDERMFWAF